MSKNVTCEFCSEKETEIPSDTNVGVDLYKSGGHWRLTYTDDLYGQQEELFTFKYCPMCGNKLLGGAEE